MTNYISEYFSKKKQNEKITKSLPEEQQIFTPTALENIIQKENDEFISSQLPRLEVILGELDDLDKEIILLYFNYEEREYKYKGYEFKTYKQRSYREIGRILNLDYRKIQRKIPHIMNYITRRLLE